MKKLKSHHAMLIGIAAGLVVGVSATLAYQRFGKKSNYISMTTEK